MHGGGTGEVVTLIGDLVASRRLSDRARAQDQLHAVLGDLTLALEPLQALEPTVGDEFQGVFPSVADATLAALLVRLAMRPVVDVRCGIGVGHVTVHDATRRPVLQDGPGWWAAREALEVLGAHPRRRSWVVGPDAEVFNSFLLCRDQLVDRLTDRGQEILRLALLGRSQKQIAATLGITTSAVSQQVARGIGAVVEAHVALSRPASGGSRLPEAGPVGSRGRADAPASVGDRTVAAPGRPARRLGRHVALGGECSRTEKEGPGSGS